jgi:voltage-gated potassium channel Kch
MMEKKNAPIRIHGNLREFALRIPPVIRKCGGIILLGKRIKSLVFSTDLAIIRNCDADAVLAVYPFTPQPAITENILQCADIPVFTGVGGGMTRGPRMVHTAMMAEMQGAIGVVANAPTANDDIRRLVKIVDIPVAVTIVSEMEDISGRIEAGAKILNVSAAGRTPALVASIRSRYPDVPIIATGGPTDASILDTIEAGANAITWTPPSTGEVFRKIMEKYRNNCGTDSPITHDEHIFSDL